MPKKQILIVDDHAVVREGLKSLINDEDDLEVCAMATGVREALRMTEAASPDLVVSDLALPDGNGLELLKDIRALHPRLPVLIMSMHDELLYAERVLKAGGQGYLMKEKSEFLIPAIRRILGGELYLSPEVTRHFLDSLSSNKTGSSFPLKRLSDREMEVFELIGQGKSNQDIGRQLNISPRTVDVHRNHIREKLGFADSNEVLRYAVRWFEGERMSGR